MRSGRWKARPSFVGHPSSARQVEGQLGHDLRAPFGRAAARRVASHVCVAGHRHDGACGVGAADARRTLSVATSHWHTHARRVAPHLGPLSWGEPHPPAAPLAPSRPGMLASPVLWKDALPARTCDQRLSGATPGPSRYRFDGRHVSHARTRTLASRARWRSSCIVVPCAFVGTVRVRRCRLPCFVWRTRGDPRGSVGVGARRSASGAHPVLASHVWG